jgi:hypothetical protein
MLIAAALLVGCNSNAVATVDQFFHDLTAGDISNAALYYSAMNDALAVTADQRDLLVAFYTRETHKILGSATKDGKTTVEVEITAPDVPAAVAAAGQKLVPVLADALNKSETLTPELMADLQRQSVSLLKAELTAPGAPTVTTRVSLRLSRTAAGWQIDDSAENQGFLNAITGNLIGGLPKLPIGG